VRHAAAFSGGVALAAASPSLLAAGAQGMPGPFVAAGVFGLLPDLLDLPVRAGKRKPHVTIRPDPLRVDGRMIADGLAQALRLASGGRRVVCVRLADVPVGTERWIDYAVVFDLEHGVMRVACPSPAERPLPVRVRLPEARRVAVGSQGPRTLVLVPEAGGVVAIRTEQRPDGWGHSPAVGLPAAAAVGLLLGAPVGLACAGAWMLHLALDGILTPANLTLRCTGARGVRVGRAAEGAMAAAVTAAAVLWIGLALWRTLPGVPAPNAMQAAVACIAGPAAALAIHRAVLTCKQSPIMVKLAFSRVRHELHATRNRRSPL
jgi:hypothetical protein